MVVYISLIEFMDCTPSQQVVDFVHEQLRSVSFDSDFFYQDDILIYKVAVILDQRTWIFFFLHE